MNIKIIDAEYYDYDHDYDDCGRKIEVILEINYIKIPLCSKCLEDLKDAITDYEFSKF